MHIEWRVSVNENAFPNRYDILRHRKFLFTWLYFTLHFANHGAKAQQITNCLWRSLLFFQLSLMFFVAVVVVIVVILLLFQAFTIIISTTYAFQCAVYLMSETICSNMYLFFPFFSIFQQAVNDKRKKKTAHTEQRWYAFKVRACGIISSLLANRMSMACAISLL